jgi:hypothetical protein
LKSARRRGSGSALPTPFALFDFALLNFLLLAT